MADLPFSSAAEPDYRPFVDALKIADPDVLLIVASAVDTALIAQQVQLSDLPVQLLTSNWALTGDLLLNGGDAVLGILTIASYSESNRSEEYQAFETRFITEYGRKPTFAASYGYESALVLAAALEKTGGQSAGLREALLQTGQLTGINGLISFDAYGDVLRNLYLVEVRDIGFETIDVIQTHLNP